MWSYYPHVSELQYLWRVQFLVHGWSYKRRTFKNSTEHLIASPCPFLQVTDTVAPTFCCCIICCWRAAIFILSKKKSFNINILPLLVWNFPLFGAIGGDRVILKTTLGNIVFAHTKRNSEFWPIASYLVPGNLIDKYEVYFWGTFQYLLYIIIHEETGMSNKPFPPVSLINIAYITNTAHSRMEYWRNAKSRSHK